MQQLIKWKDSPYRKPLILKGVRQVGKTWLLKEFGRLCYENTAYFNFDENEEYRQFFETTQSVERILQNLMLASGQKILPEKTLIIFDEVQDCPKVINSMKYFCENAPQYHVACADSLLGIALAKPASFPVGKVNFMQVNPMTFSEFLLANGALGDSDTVEIRKRLIQNDMVEAIVILPRELFITTDISVTLWILNRNIKGGAYHGRTLRDRSHEILFMDLRTWTENPVKGESKKKVQLVTEQIERAAEIYHTWQDEGTDGDHYEVPELYRSVGIKEIEKQNWSLVPSKYIRFIDHDLEIDFSAEMRRIQVEMKAVMLQEKESQAMLLEAFRGIGYGID